MHETEPKPPFWVENLVAFIIFLILLSLIIITAVGSNPVIYAQF